MNHIDSVVTLPVIFADEVCCAAGFRHGVIKVTQGGREIEQPQLFHQLTDAAGGKARLKAGTIRIFKIVHIPGVRVAVGSAELRGKFHAVAVFLRIRPVAALAAINAHGRRHHGPFVVFAQALDVRALGHAQNERGEHRAADDVHENRSPFSKSGSSRRILRYCFFAAAVTAPAVFGSRPNTALRFFRNEPANTAHIPVCMGTYFICNSSCGMP